MGFGDSEIRIKTWIATENLVSTDQSLPARAARAESVVHNVYQYQIQVQYTRPGAGCQGFSDVSKPPLAAALPQNAFADSVELDVTGFGSAYMFMQVMDNADRSVRLSRKNPQ